MRITNKLFLPLFIFFIFTSCQNVKNTLSMKKEQGTDEFLIEKKNPLVLPPDFSKLPLPKNEKKDNTVQNESIDLSKILQETEDKEKVTQSNELEKSISEILNKK